MRPSRTWMSAVVALAAVGCGGRGNPDLLEARLRQQEDAMFRVQGELASAQTDLQAARRETQALRSQLDGQGQVALLPEQAGTLFRASGIQVQKLLTGGLDRDGLPGDDALNVAVTPADAHGEPVKVPGAVRFELLDMAAPDGQRQVGLWEFSADQSAQQWQSNFLGSGYRFQLPWQTPPGHAELMLHVRLTTADGRQFDTTHPVRIVPGATPRIAQQPPQPGSPQPAPAQASAQTNVVRPVSSPQPAPQPLELKPLRTGDRKADVSRLWNAPTRKAEPREPMPFPGFDEEPLPPAEQAKPLFSDRAAAAPAARTAEEPAGRVRLEDAGAHGTGRPPFEP